MIRLPRLYYRYWKVALVRLRAVAVLDPRLVLTLRTHCRRPRRPNRLSQRPSQSHAERRRLGKIQTTAHFRLISQLRKDYASYAMRRQRTQWQGGNTNAVCGGSLRRLTRRQGGRRTHARSEGDLVWKGMRTGRIQRWTRCLRVRVELWDGLRGERSSRERSTSSGYGMQISLRLQRARSRLYSFIPHPG